MDDKTPSSATTEWYTEYYRKQGADRNDLLRNPGVLFQTVAYDVSVIRALRHVVADPRSTSVLDVGCGSGGSIWNLLRLGFEPGHICGIDITEDRIARARRTFPSVKFWCADASSMDFPDRAFDIVMESTMFVQITNEELAAGIASEMLRVTKPGGHLLLMDWRYDKPGHPEYRSLGKRRLSKLFAVGRKSRICGTYRGALVPPVGRFLSKFAPPTYFLVDALLPFLAGQVTTVLAVLAE